jgi:hypothetical protein
MFDATCIVADLVSASTCEVEVTQGSEVSANLPEGHARCPSGRSFDWSID